MCLLNAKIQAQLIKLVFLLLGCRWCCGIATGHEYGHSHVLPVWLILKPSLYHAKVSS